MRLDIAAGPNGSGKSTFVELVLAPCRPGVTFVNADVIAAARWPDDPTGHAYDAARGHEPLADDSPVRDVPGGRHGTARFWLPWPEDAPAVREVVHGQVVGAVMPGKGLQNVSQLRQGPPRPAGPAANSPCGATVGPA